jgi:hypothetical protein
MYRIVPIEAVLLWFLFIMKGTLSVDNNTYYNPDVNFLLTLKSPMNYALKYFFNVLFLTVVATVIYIFRNLTRYVFPLSY